MIVGGYTLDLYCDNSEIKAGEVTDRHGHDFQEFPHQFYAETGEACRRKARKQGWRLDMRGAGKAYCPKCTKRGKTA